MQVESEILGELDGIEAAHNTLAGEMIGDVQSMASVVMKDLKVIAIISFIILIISPLTNASIRSELMSL